MGSRPVCRLDTHLIAECTEMIEEFGQHLVGRHQSNRPDLPADLDGPYVPLILAVCEGYPIKGIGKDAPHAVGRFGVP